MCRLSTGPCDTVGGKHRNSLFFWFFITARPEVPAGATSNQLVAWSVALLALPLLQWAMPEEAINRTDFDAAGAYEGVLTLDDRDVEVPQEAIMHVEPAAPWEQGEEPAAEEDEGDREGDLLQGDEAEDVERLWAPVVVADDAEGGTPEPGDVDAASGGGGAGSGLPEGSYDTEAVGCEEREAGSWPGVHAVVIERYSTGPSADGSPALPGRAPSVSPASSRASVASAQEQEQDGAGEVAPQVGAARNAARQRRKVASADRPNGLRAAIAREVLGAHPNLDAGQAPAFDGLWSWLRQRL